MKNYSMNSEDRKFFVCGFRYDNKGNIIVNFPKHENNVVPKNEMNEQILKDKMEDQVRGSETFMKKVKNTIRDAKIATTIFGVILGILVSSISKLTDEEIVKEIVLKFFATFSFGCTIISFGKYVNAKMLLKDLRKNKRFLSIKDTLNNNVKINKNMVANTSNKTKMMVSKTPDEKEVFDINSFNNVPYKDLMKIMDNIERYERFGFDYENVEFVKKRKTKKRVR